MQKFEKKQVQRNFSNRAGSYDANSRLQKRVAIEMLNRTGKLDGKILDIGAGTGMIRKNSEFADLVEMDFSLDMCKKNSGLAVNADAENLPFADDSFDHVISSLTIQWLNNLDVFAVEMKRVLKSGGSFHLSTFGNGTLTELSQSFAELDDAAHIISFPNTIFLFAILKKAGFEAIDIHAQTITYRHETVLEILQQMKNIGATYPLRDKSKGLAGKEYFAKLDAVYRRKFADGEGKLPVTWNALYISGSKK